MHERLDELAKRLTSNIAVQRIWQAVPFSIAQHFGNAIIGFVYIMAIQTLKFRNLLQELSSALALHAWIIRDAKPIKSPVTP